MYVQYLLDKFIFSLNVHELMNMCDYLHCSYLISADFFQLIIFRCCYSLAICQFFGKCIISSMTFDILTLTKEYQLTISATSRQKSLFVMCVCLFVLCVYFCFIHRSYWLTWFILWKVVVHGKRGLHGSVGHDFSLDLFYTSYKKHRTGWKMDTCDMN